MWAGALASNIGTWMETVALSYYVADTTGQASWSAVVSAAGFLPGAVLGPIGSAMADRLNRRRVLMLGNLVSAVVAAVLAVWVGGGTAGPLGIAILGFIAGSINSFVFPSFQVTLPELVAREHLVAAVGLSNAQWNLGRIVGPAIAGLAIAFGGIGLALWINAFSFFAVILAVSQVRFSQRAPVYRPIFAALADGARFARSNPAMRRMVGVMAIVIGVGAPFIAFVSQFATNVFGGDERSTSLLVAAQGVGAVAAAFTLGSITRRHGARRVMFIASFGMCLGLFLYGRAPSLWLAAPCLTLIGASYGFAFTSFSGIAQSNAPDEMRGRVLAVNSFILGLLYPVGTVLQGALADWTSLRTVTTGSGIVMAAALVLVLRAQRSAVAPPLATSSV